MSRRDVVVVDSGGANLASIGAAFERAGATVRVTADPDEIRAADRVVLPGVGAAGPAMARVRARGLDAVLPRLTQPVLGICVGMQLLYERSDEGDTPCLGVLRGDVAALPRSAGVRVPHIGWNRVVACGDAPLCAGLGDDAYAYFVHSYAAPADAQAVASCTHGAAFAAAVSHRNFHGVQFHPERSGAVGARVLANWLALA